MTSLVDPENDPVYGGQEVQSGFQAARPTWGTVLVVEDHKAVREIIVLALKRSGYNVISASVGEDAVALADEECLAIDALITDLIMPGMRGTEVAALLSDKNPHLKTILMSGYPDRLEHDHDVRIAHVVVEKPFNPFDLVGIVSELLARDPRPREIRRL